MILCGKSHYEKLGIGKHPKNTAELKKLICGMFEDTPTKMISRDEKNKIFIFWSYLENSIATKFYHRIGDSTNQLNELLDK